MFVDIYNYSCILSMSSLTPSRKKAREKDQEQTPVEEHKQMGQDASKSEGKASSCGGCATKSAMPGMNFYITHSWGVRPISVDCDQFLLNISIVNDKQFNATDQL